MLPFLISRPNRPVVCLLWLFVMGLTRQAHAACTIPQALQGTWVQSSSNKNITMTADGTQGQEVKAGSKNYTGGFECATSSGDTYVFRTKTTVLNPGNTQSRGYFCWQLIRQTPVSILLYDLTAISTSGAFRDQAIYETSITDPDPPLSAVCSLSASTQAPAVLYKRTSGGALEPISVAEKQCSPELFATYSYVQDGANCMGSKSSLDFCKGRIIARANYSLCTSKILFSRDGLLSCVGSVSFGSTVYQLLYNHDDTVDDSNYFKFVCLKVIKSGDSEEATVYPKDCGAVGKTTHKLALQRTVSCPISDDSSELNIALIVVSVVLGVIIIAVVVALILVIYLLVKLQRKQRAVTPVKLIRNGKPVHTNPEAPPPAAAEESIPSGLDERRGSRLPPLETTAPRTEPLRQ